MACGVSLMVHVLLLVLFAIIILPQANSTRVTTIVSEFSTDDALAIDDSIKPEILSVNEDSTESTSMQDQSIFNRIPDTNADASPQLDFAPPLVLSNTEIAAGGLNEKVSPLATSTASSSTATGVDTTSQSGDSGIGFFGLELNGSKVVYVVDCSRSMNYPYPGEAKTRFGRVQLELLNTINKLDESQKFFMIFFNDLPLPMPAERLLEATPAVKQHYLTWMTSLKPVSNTDPEQALLLALQLRPEVIYFLTDGDFNYRVVPSVTRANRTGVVINTIGFGDERGALFLKEIAARNSGQYRYIPSGEVSTTQSIVSQLKMKTQAQREKK